MKKCFTKLLALLFVVTETIFSAGSVHGLSYRNALQMPEIYIKKIHNCARSVNLVPEVQLDVTLDGAKVGMRTLDRDSVVYAFKDTDIHCDDILSLARNIFTDNHNKEIVLTGYGKGANFAAKVASNIGKKCGGFEDSKQVKVIAFCADSEFDDDFSNSNCDHLSCRLHFGKRDRTPPYDTSKMIEFNMLPTLPERFSIPKCAIGATVLIGTNWLLKVTDKDGKISKKAKKIINAIGVVGVAALSLSKQHGKYFSNNEICSRFMRAKGASWSAEVEYDWRYLGA